MIRIVEMSVRLGIRAFRGTKKGRACRASLGRRRGSAPREGVLDQIRRGGNAAGLSCVGPRATLLATNMISAGGINADRPKAVDLGARNCRRCRCDQRLRAGAGG